MTLVFPLNTLYVIIYKDAMVVSSLDAANQVEHILLFPEDVKRYYRKNAVKLANEFVKQHPDKSIYVDEKFKKSFYKSVYAE